MTVLFSRHLIKATCNLNFSSSLVKVKKGEMNFSTFYLIQSNVSAYACFFKVLVGLCILSIVHSFGNRVCISHLGQTSPLWLHFERSVPTSGDWIPSWPRWAHPECQAEGGGQ